MSATSLLVMLAGNICYVVVIAIMPGLAFPPTVSSLFSRYLVSS